MSAAKKIGKVNGANVSSAIPYFLKVLQRKPSTSQLPQRPRNRVENYKDLIYSPNDEKEVDTHLRWSELYKDFDLSSNRRIELLKTVERLEKCGNWCHPKDVKVWYSSVDYAKKGSLDLNWDPNVLKSQRP